MESPAGQTGLQWSLHRVWRGLRKREAIPGGMCSDGGCEELGQVWGTPAGGTSEREEGLEDQEGVLWEPGAAGAPRRPV